MSNVLRSDVRDLNEAEKLLKQKAGTVTNIECPDCGKALVVRNGYSKFLGCSDYPNCQCTVGILNNAPVSREAPFTRIAFEGGWVNDGKLRGTFITEEEIVSVMNDTRIDIHCADDM